MVCFQIAVAVWYFSAGADRALIIPTVNAYLTEYLGAPQERYLDFLQATLDQIFFLDVNFIGRFLRLVN
jgi:hypothetical protein